MAKKHKYENVFSFITTRDYRLHCPISKICTILLMNPKTWMVSLIIMFAVSPICAQDAIFKMSSVSPVHVYTSITIFITFFHKPLLSHMVPLLCNLNAPHIICSGNMPSGHMEPLKYPGNLLLLSSTSIIQSASAITWINPLCVKFLFEILTHCGQWWPRHERSGSTMAQVMACCLTAPSHYLNHFLDSHQVIITH